MKEIEQYGLLKDDEWEEQNSGTDLFRFDSDEDIFCIYSQYIDNLLRFAKTLRAACDDESIMLRYLCLSRFTPEHRSPEFDYTEELSDGFSVRFQSFGGEIGNLHLQMSESVLFDSSDSATDAGGIKRLKLIQAD